MQPIIELRNVTYQYPGANTPVLRDVNLTIEKGDFVAILGGNGSGKSTMCKLFNGLIPHYYVGDLSGKVTVNSRSTLDHKVSDFSKTVGYVYQDFENQIVSPRVLEDASFAPLHFGLPDFEERGIRALEVVGLLEHRDEFVWQLSGGQKHLLALASILSLNPDIIIIDEPSAQLDPQHAREIYKLLQKLNKEEGKTIIVIEHHTEFVAEFANTVILMNQGSIEFKLPVVKALNEIELLEQHQIFPPQVTQAAAKCFPHKEQLPITIRESLDLFERGGQMEEEVSSPGPEREVIVQYDKVCYSYQTITKKKKRVLHDINLTINEGDYIALVGNNGAGKSTLMRLLTGLIKQEIGNVFLGGKDIRKTTPEKLAERITYIYQNPEQMFIDDSVEKDIGFYLRARKHPQTEKIVNQLVEQFHLKELKKRDSRLLSGGQQRRASLAIGMGMNPQIMLLDEPTANLDISTRKQVSRLLAQLKSQLKAVVIATHDMQLACEFANRIIVMHEGRIIHDGDKYSVYANQWLLKKAGLYPPQIFTLSKELEWKHPVFSVEEFVQQYERREVSYGVWT
ncbi:energy-coupling factor transport system ATP-binding protein [Gracilibacillus halotolerans]|uniref:Energy-coupling factor transport system ATP-binding protein n=1 Tax=Gracilibacillus halotolerans TaxID=74386 RepID=A0A841RLC4_9BACI|nr:energy-coupling factor transporter ATPase [Gracilibacillus halotolerans]MBB6512742.1 energy-coupling factor transport system ATP-binding protein [Gracilibacillus halotolerans]